jgi:nucleotide-binding universal stress UspA family protein
LPYHRIKLAGDLAEQLDHAVSGWTEKYPDVPVERRVTQGPPGEVLAELSRQARLVVVGTRGHGLVAGPLLGSVGYHLLHRADCPVLIARPGPTER